MSEEKEIKIVKVKLTKATVIGSRATKAGKEIELPEPEAKNLIRRGRAEAVKAKVEAAK